MLFAALFASAVLPALALATPTPPMRRAGGPSVTPIPANCTVTSPFAAGNFSTGAGGYVNGYQPSNATSKNQVYAWYLTLPDYETVDERWTTCIEQCNGFSGCKSALLAYDVPTPKGYYGTPGGALDVACLMYNITLTPSNFINATAGQYLNETAGVINCPSS